MIRKLIPGAILALLAGAAHADDLSGNSVTLYGVLDVAVGTVEHSANGSPTEAITVDPERVPRADHHSVMAAPCHMFAPLTQYVVAGRSGAIPNERTT
jgi:porin-like protein